MRRVLAVVVLAVIATSASAYGASGLDEHRSRRKEGVWTSPSILKQLASGYGALEIERSHMPEKLTILPAHHRVAPLPIVAAIEQHKPQPRELPSSYG